jgi:hypothetical protein
MLQQVNLYQPMFREEHKLFSAGTIGVALGIMTLGLLSISLYSWWRLASLDRQLAAVQAQETVKQALVARTNSIVGQGESEESFGLRLKAMAFELERRQRALRYLEGTAAGATANGEHGGADAGDNTGSGRAGGVQHGFAGRLAALARQQLDGLWLTGVSLTGDADDLGLSGRATRPELVPIYLERLANEAALAGTQLQSIEIRQPKRPLNGEIEFVVSSSPALDSKELAPTSAAVQRGTP